MTTGLKQHVCAPEVSKPATLLPRGDGAKHRAGEMDVFKMELRVTSCTFCITQSLLIVDTDPPPLKLDSCVNIAVVLPLVTETMCCILPCITLTISKGKSKDKTKLLAAHSSRPRFISLNFSPSTVFQSVVALLQHHSTDVLLPLSLSLVINVAGRAAPPNSGIKKKKRKK